ncbi:MAG TPA: beta-eliminating lyase-related protein, partial [Longimicrobiales bacterium]
MERARVVRRRLGGSLRQSGIFAAAALYALEHHRGRLAEDHANAALLAERAARIDGLRVVTPETNIVMMDVARPGFNAEKIVAAMKERGVLLSAFTPTRIRAVTHLDVDRQAIETAASELREVLR